jgi:Kdo2-lipid IVA lauroyltransferase/acyltransferase
MKRDTGIGAWCVYAVVRVLVGVLRCFPVNVNLRTARLFAHIWWHAIPRHRRRARAHLRLAYGDSLPEEEIVRLARASFEALAMLAIDFFSTPALITEWTWHKYVRLHNMREALRVLLAGNGAIILTGHYGNWELAGYLLALFGFDVAAIMRPLDNVYLNRYVVENRRRKGLELLDKKGAMQSAEPVIRRGGALGFIADQNAGSKGMFVDFFGTAASTYKSIGLLAMRTRVPIIIGYARRIEQRFEFEVGVERIIYPQEWDAQDDPLRWITQEYTAALEAAIRRAPEQYLWIHRRWKSRPRSETNPPAALRS